MASVASHPLLSLLSSQIWSKNQIFPSMHPSLSGFVPIRRTEFRSNLTRSVVTAQSALISVDTKGVAAPPFEFDAASDAELKEKGFLGLRKTKLVCTVGPACSSLEQLERLALGGMNVARLNMCHNTREWHRDVIRNAKRLNEEKGFCISLMIDTEGSQMNMVDIGDASSIKAEVKCYK